MVLSTSIPFIRLCCMLQCSLLYICLLYDPVVSNKNTKISGCVCVCHHHMLINVQYICMKDKDINDDTDESIFLDYSINTKNNVEEASFSRSRFNVLTYFYKNVLIWTNVSSLWRYLKHTLSFASKDKEYDFARAKVFSSSGNYSFILLGEEIFSLIVEGQ